MKTITPPLKSTERFSPKTQTNWDWRAACNFIGGGAGGSLLFWAALAALGGADFRPLAFLGMVLVGAGLTCVWFEIGRPWRALNVFNHFSTSWMTREASVAPLLFLMALAAWIGHPILTGLAGLLGAVFLYAQARILKADKGIPAWRHPGCQPLMLSTGLTEGLGLLVAALALTGAPQTWALIALLILLLSRVITWRAYRAGLKRDGAPLGTLRALADIDTGLLMAGHLAPVLLLVIAYNLPLAAVIAGLLAAGSGWWLKYTIIRRAAYTQGFALAHIPSRGRGSAGPQVKPGWNTK